ncbi:hypothetical protein PoB_007337300 [Plakobranchus ocellatus]|uniref:Uncharacterized protein n=1 Tax=Plakobranchus ocellatus TaxID=259542 RepID=A0AAV4DS06_9GAST|nr:hypothetical protein PoB_007337300 [Plakobranchus ocellatus]
MATSFSLLPIPHDHHNERRTDLHHLGELIDCKNPRIAVPSGVTIVSDDSLLVADYHKLSLHPVSSGGRWLKQVLTASSTSAKDDKLRNVSVESYLCVCVTRRDIAYVLNAVS